MSFISNPDNNLFALTIMGFIVMFFASFQDVAVDGMAIDILPVDQQARANGLMWGSKTFGVAVSVALGSQAINMQLHDWKRIFRNLVNVFFLPMSLIMGIAAFFSTISRGLMDTVLPVLTVQELGWLDTEYSQIFATSGGSYRIKEEWWAKFFSDGAKNKSSNLVTSEILIKQFGIPRYV